MVWVIIENGYILKNLKFYQVMYFFNMYKSSYYRTSASNRCLAYSILDHTFFGTNFRPF